MPPLIEHEAILASAGSGKTFQLAHRYIRLLAHGVEPQRIIAITFSRKAAGEIFTAIVRQLTTACQSSAAARDTGERIGLPAFTVSDFRTILRRFLSQLQQLHISTIDSFTIGILRAFPLELGLSPEFSVTNNESTEAVQARLRALQRLFSDLRESDQVDELLEAFKQATFGQETKSFTRIFDAFIAEYQQLFKQLPDADAWGNPRRIWTEEHAGWLAPPPDMEAAVACLREDVERGDWDAYAQGKWTDFLDALSQWRPGMPWKQIAYLADRLIFAVASQPDNEASIALKLNRTTYQRSGREASAMRTVVQHLMSSSLRAALASTAGIYHLLARFDDLYDQSTRRPGLLTFNDAQYLMAHGEQRFSRSSDDPTRLQIDFRLDNQLDHWLMDEFQDTSDLQWSVLKNLADEVVQDATGTRSFFFVGDVKQAIYAWRGGNHQLFGQLLDTYGPRIHQRQLHTSYRSSPPVLEVVNRVFDQLPVGADALPQEVVDQWRRYWAPHQCPPERANRGGYATLIEAGQDRNDRDALYQVCANLLTEIAPLERGLTTAILVRSNNTAAVIANFLRARLPHTPIALDGESNLADNTVVAVLLALIHYALHPGDTMALHHLRMSPLHDPEADTAWSAPALLAQWYRQGAHDFLAEWGDRLREACPLDRFGAQRLQALLEAAREFERNGQQRPEAFLLFARNYTLPEPTSDAAVRVMTVHKSKGLGFDIVLLPELVSHRGMNSDSDVTIHLARDAQGTPKWALRWPDKIIREHDPVLAQETHEQRVANSFEQVCNLYVALTRAKSGLYMIVPPLPKSGSKSLTPANLLRQQLPADADHTPAGDTNETATHGTILYETGDPEWFSAHAPQVQRMPPIEEPISPRFCQRPSLRRRLLRVSPSMRSEAPRPAALLFAPKVNRSLDLGTHVHALFEQVEWSETTTPEQAIDRWQVAHEIDDPEAVAHFQAAYASQSFQAALAKPTAAATVWRERMFEAVIDGEWITGMFDRVVIEYDADGKVRAARIQDFKTNDVPPDGWDDVVNHYRPQLRLYARALAKLLRFPAADIECVLLFTRAHRIVIVPS